MSLKKYNVLVLKTHLHKYIYLTWAHVRYNVYMYMYMYTLVPWSPGAGTWCQVRGTIPGAICKGLEAVFPIQVSEIRSPDVPLVGAWGTLVRGCQEDPLRALPWGQRRDIRASRRQNTPETPFQVLVIKTKQDMII